MTIVASRSPNLDTALAIMQLGLPLLDHKAIRGWRGEIFWEEVGADIELYAGEGASRSLSPLEKVRTARLWTNDVRESEKFVVNFPPWARSYWDGFKNSTDAKRANFGPWVEWYESFLGSVSLTVNRPGSFNRSSGKTASLEQMRQLLEYELKLGTVRADIVNARIFELIPDRHSSKSAISTTSPPSEPEAGPGPQYYPLDGKLTEIVSPPQTGEAESQESLRKRQHNDVSSLLNSLVSSHNDYHVLKSVLAEYAELISAPGEEVDVVGIWSVGGAIASFAQSYREQDVAKTLSNPLEPIFAGKLAHIVRQHGAFVMGYGQGRDLVHRADEFALDRIRLNELSKSGSPLLAEVTSNSDLVDERARKVHQAVYDAILESGWAASRTGYTAYLIVRNCVRAMVRFTFGPELSVTSVAGVLAAGSALAGDPNAAFIRAAVPVLLQHGAQMLAFFNHSPEMRAYIEWALMLLSHDRSN